ncbi:amino acid adenylation domain-containing protein [Pseudoalteromonas sp. Isolate6]|uniref:non-ribosomal peptide synthetase n=1 Tax=Pseudoalteromonas sp. Isolate6 TaxID=2908527 RepID=UPI001EFE7963|nr:non-ribosomal peptide synthetase [Pseudoalteromonas sp. Isolate6]MCG9760752.1 amino acid adenylation domain-containing protein [Pseudoalteromonas sp. Isolate6]
MTDLSFSHSERVMNSCAIRDDNHSLTYAQLCDKTAQLVAVLNNAISASQAVAICLPRSMALAASVNACFGARIPYIPIDPDLPAKRVDYMLAQSQPAAILTTRQIAENLDYDANFIYLDSWLTDDSPLLIARVAKGTCGANYPTDTAYIIYTSGSTGKPKGVEMTHSAIANLLQVQQELEPEIGKSYRTIQFTSISFDVAVQEILTCFYSGAELVITTKEDVRDPKALLRKLCQQSIERIFMPSPVLQALAEEAKLCPELRPVTLQVVIVAGEKLLITPEIRALFAGLQTRLVNQYGPSETHVVTQYSCLSPLSDEQDVPAIGEAINCVGIYIVNEQGQVVPYGEEGEIWVTGVAVAKGYLHDAAKTAEVFVPNKFDNLSEKLYKTGDLAIKNAQGVIHYRGRRQGLVKLNGYRIELAEIEAVTAALAQVKYAQCFVLSSTTDESKKQLALFVQVEDETLSSEEVRSELSAHLPSYMIPTQILVSTTLPLNINQKVDREKIKSLFSTSSAATSKLPTGINEQLLHLFREMLGQPNFMMADDFFHAGGSSVLAMLLVRNLRKRLNIAIDVNDFYRLKTPEALMAFLSGK